MAKSICIWTPSGLKCASSPIVEHHLSGDGKMSGEVASFASEAASKAAERAQAACARVAAVLKGEKEDDVIARVVALMIAANVDENTPFAIVKAM